MLELLNEAISPANLVYTIFLGLSLFYWMFVMMGAMDLDGLDFDIDIDADADVDIDGNVSGGGNFLSGILVFFNFGKVPFMVIQSFTSLWMWTIAMLTNHHFGGGDIMFAVAMFIPILFIGLLITKLVTTPLLPFFEALSDGEEAIDYEGQIAVLKVSATKKRVGKAEILIGDNTNSLTVKISGNSEKDYIDRDEKIVILSISDDEKFYWIDKL